MHPTITIKEANDRVEGYTTKVREALPAEAQYDVFSSEEAGSCTDPSDGGSQDRVLASRTFKVLGLPREKIPSYFDALRGWWQNHDFRVLDNNPPNEYLWVENNADSFRMAFEANVKGELFLTATSPCVWPNGTPEPQAAAEEPAREPAVAQSAAPPAAPKPAQARRPRRAPAEETEDFDQTDWTSEA